MTGRVSEMLGERLAAVRRKLGFSQVELAAAMGGRYDQSMISHVETGRASLVAEGLVRAAEVLGVSVDYLLGLTNNPERQTNLSSIEDVDIPGMARVQEINTTIEFGKVVELDLSVRDLVAVPMPWLVEKGIDQKTCFFVRFRGDSMFPSLPGECRLLVDRRNLQPGNRRIYLVNSLEGALVKRILWHDELDWVLQSDNRTAGGTVPLDDTIKIIGEVVWFEGTP